MCSILLQLAPGSRDLSQAERGKNCCCKLSKFAKWQVFSLKAIKVVILSEKSCDFVNLRLVLHNSYSLLSLR